MSRLGRFGRLGRSFWVGVGVGSVLGVVATLAGLVGLGLLMGSLLESEMGLPPPPIPAESHAGVYGRMPYDWSVSTLDGRTVALDSLRGRVVVVHFWATWCGPCVKELPQIAALAESLRSDGVTLLALSEESARTIRAFLWRRGLGMPAYRAPPPIPRALVTPGIPSTFVVDRAGWIRLRHVGAAGWNDESARRFVRRLARQREPSDSDPIERRDRRRS